MVRRHRLLETFLATTLGYPWEEVHDEAERLEHAASDAMIERIDAQLGRPTADPHGDPIPTAQGRTRRPLNTTRLTEAKPGGYEIIRLSDADPQRLTRFRDCGLVPGGAFRVIAQEASGTTGVPEYHHTAIKLAPTEAEAIWVTPTLNTQRSL
ncbi:metal-dependent transcriptional regulator [Kocuria rosea]|uniref:metal-dependent transcriptional regulator n=2 Tax=Micrococcaceae TaxID=1268 RepID=UPI000AC2CFD3|nr:metal-dependent transcriptional regulator [Kocuria polaris]